MKTMPKAYAGHVTTGKRQKRDIREAQVFILIDKNHQLPWNDNRLVNEIVS